MPKYGLLTSATKPIPVQIRKLVRLGFDYVEIGIEAPLATPELIIRDKAHILKSLRKYEMPSIGHTAYWVQFGTSHNEARKGWVREAKHMIGAAHSLSLPYLNFHFNGGEGQTTEGKSFRKEFAETFAGSMRELSAFAAKKGVKLMLENAPIPESKRGAYSIKEFSYVIENTPNLLVHLDIPHAFVEGGMPRIGDYIRKFHDKIVHLHVHDNNGQHDDHFAIGKGKINFKKAVKMLKSIDYNGTVTFEVFKSDKEAVTSRNIFQKLWESE